MNETQIELNAYKEAIDDILPEEWVELLQEYVADYVAKRMEDDR